MASSVMPPDQLADDADPARGEIASLGPALRAVLLPLASLRLTVALFAMAIFIVFAGTMAQTKHDIWYVVHNYFRTAIAWIDLQVFFPKSFFPTLGPVSGSFPFPGGWLIGAAMAVNLLAAHALRFTVQARGARLTTGLGVIGLGVLVTGLVVAGGSSEGIQGVPIFEWKTLWVLCETALAALAIIGLWFGIQMDPAHRLSKRTLIGASGALGFLVAWLVVRGDAVALGDSSMRILWQLLQGGLAGGVLLAGCWLVFLKRAGIVLLHAGVGLMMFSELLVGTTAIEGQMDIREGDTVNYAQDIRSVELAIVDESDPNEDRVVVVPQSLVKDDAVIDSKELPFEIRVVRYLQNADLRSPKEGEQNPATAGIGKDVIAVKVAEGVGTDSSGEVDQSAAYVEFRKKAGDRASLGTYLLSVMQSRMQDSRERSGWSDAEVRAGTGPFMAKVTQPTLVDLDGKPYRVALRFKRSYTPFSVRLIDVHTGYYPGTRTPKDYSSLVQLKEPARGIDREVKIWMNNPLRFGGMTFYQSKVGLDAITRAESTILAVVTNSGWMIPYVSCMIVAVGMMFQFGQTLLRFLRRREAVALSSAVVAAPARQDERSQRDPARSPRRREAALATDGPAVAASASPQRRDWVGLSLSVGIVALFAFYVLGHAFPPKPTADGFDLYAAGQLPLLYQGRAKPIDTLARNTLQVISNAETFIGPMDPVTRKEKWSTIEGKLKGKWKALAAEDLSKFATGQRANTELADFIEARTKADRHEIDDYVYKVTSSRQLALRWLLDVVSELEIARRHRVFRIDSLPVLDMFELQRRDGFLYSLEEILPQSEKFHKEAEKAREKPVASLSTSERKLLDLDRRFRAFTAVAAAFRRPDQLTVPPPAGIRERIIGQRDALLAQLREQEKDLIEHGQPPLVVPFRVAEGKGSKLEWKPFASAWIRDYFESRVLGERALDPATEGWDAVLTAWEHDDANGFNRAVRKYQTLMADEAPADLQAAHPGFETYFNIFSPFFQAWVLYIVAFVLSVAGWLLLPVRRAAFWLLVFTFAVHSFALVSRIYISGRPPVTNLYSSAVFIGWGAVLLGLVLEAIYRLGIGNAIASIAGIAALFISFKLSGDGDTFTVMQAVLDTQFWLATHVICVSLGYATTFLSGILGAFHVVRGIFVRDSAGSETGKSLARMIYGTLCFAIFFSFVGTVLGGLWADDSWGRFWGWDPKENGALMIVLWNALVLHARWGAMVKDRGLAVLAVAGNIVTGWSWFGVNELGVGLHSYGFTEGVLFTLGMFVLSQLALIAIGTTCALIYRPQPRVAA